MGTYATTTELAIVLVGTEMDTETSALVSKCINWGESEINKYLSKRYDLSSQQFQNSTLVPPLIRSLCEQLAEGYYYTRASRGSKESLKRGTEMLKLARDNLTLIMGYQASLTDSTGALVPDFSNTAYRVLSNTSNYSPTFNEDKPERWKIDPDKLNDISDERG